MFDAVIHSGNPYTMMSAIRAGKLSLGIIGASIAQNGGCYDPLKRCWSFSGFANTRRQIYDTDHVWKSTKDKHEGFIVRFSNMIARDFNTKITIHNAALDATPIHAILDCFHTYIPPHLDAVIIEPGSMAKYTNGNKLRQVVQQIRSMTRIPHMIFILFHEWVRYKNHEFYKFDENTPWQQMENAALQICMETNSTCISPRRELYHTVDAYTIHNFVGKDGLHIVNSRNGTEYVFNILAKWMREVSVRKHEPPAINRLPPATSPAACFKFSHKPRRFKMIEWITSDCYNCSKVKKRESCNYLSKHWTFCEYTNKNKFNISKHSPAIVSTNPGSELVIDVDTSSFSQPVIVVEYLTSYENIGFVNYKCIRGCACDDGIINGVRRYNYNSIYERYNIHTYKKEDLCKIKFILGGTINSLFRIRWIFVLNQNYTY